MIVLNIALDFAPWILLWTSRGSSFRRATLFSLAVSALLCAWKVRRGPLKRLQLATLACFVALVALAYSASGPWVQLHAAPMGNFALCTVVLLTILAGDPFIREYARERHPPEHWNHPLFLRATRFLSLLWAVGFAAMGTFQLLAVWHPERETLYRWYLPYSLDVALIAFSFWWPRVARAQWDAALARGEQPR